MSEELLSEKIVAKKIDGVKKWVVVSHEGKNLGAFPFTQNGKHQAHVRLGQVEAFKKRDEKKKAKLKEAEEVADLQVDDFVVYKDSYGKKKQAFIDKIKNDKLFLDNGDSINISQVSLKKRKNKKNGFSVYESTNWKDIYSKCPKCKSSDIKSVNSDTKKCNSCGNKFSFDNKLKESQEKLDEAKSITIKKDSSTGEYRVPAPDGKEAGAYYTDDKQDAIDTAKDMYKRAKIDDIEIKFRTVSDFDMYNESQLLDEAVTFKVGDKVKISGGSGIDSDKEAVVVDKSKIKTNERGVPTNTVDNPYKPVNWNDEVAIQLKGGGLKTMYKNRLIKLKESNVQKRLLNLTENYKTITAKGFITKGKLFEDEKGYFVKFKFDHMDLRLPANEKLYFKTEEEAQKAFDREINSI